MIIPAISVTSLVGSLDVRVDGKRLTLVQPEKDITSLTLEGRDFNDVCTKINATTLLKADLLDGRLGPREAKFLVRTASIRLDKGKSYVFKADDTHLKLPVDLPKDVRIVTYIDEDDMDTPFMRPATP